MLMILRLVETWLRAGPPETPEVIDLSREDLFSSTNQSDILNDVAIFFIFFKHHKVLGPEPSMLIRIQSRSYL
jgi:hypothetical protein